MARVVTRLGFLSRFLDRMLWLVRRTTRAAWAPHTYSTMRMTNGTKCRSCLLAMVSLEINMVNRSPIPVRMFSSAPLTTLWPTLIPARSMTIQVATKPGAMLHLSRHQKLVWTIKILEIVSRSQVRRLSSVHRDMLARTVHQSVQDLCMSTPMVHGLRTHSFRGQG